ncbi:MAG: DUF4403 family protein [Bacteroidota bacterium]
MNISIHLDLGLLEKSIREEFGDPQEWTDSEDFSSAFTEIELEQLHPLELRIIENKLVTFLSLKTNLMLKRNNPLLMSLPTMEKISMQVGVSTLTSIAITPTWELEAQTSIGFDWQKKPSWGGGLVKLPLSTMLAPIFERELKKIAEVLDDRIKEGVNLPLLAAESWKKLHEPGYFPIGENLHLYMRFSPKYSPILLEPIVMREKELRLSMQADLGDFIMQTQELSPFPTSILPEAIIEKIPSEMQQLQVEGQFSFLEINEMIGENLAYFAEQDGMQIHKLHINPSAHDSRFAEMEVNMLIRQSGLRLQGTLMIDFSMFWQNSHNTVGTQINSCRLIRPNLVLRLINWLQPKRIQHMIDHQVEAALNMVWKGIKGEILQELSKTELEDGIELRVQQADLVPQHLGWNETGLSYFLQVKGYPQIHLTELDF